jgi:hypothetical protein
MAEHKRAELVVEALEMAVGRHKPEPGLVHHSDSETAGVWLGPGGLTRTAIDRERIGAWLPRASDPQSDRPVVSPRNCRPPSPAAGALASSTV